MALPRNPGVAKVLRGLFIEDSLYMADIEVQSHRSTKADVAYLQGPHWQQTFGDGHALDDWLAAEREICYLGNGDSA